MKNWIVMTAACLSAGAAAAQQLPAVPPDYVPPQTNAVDAQIQAVHRNYVDTQMKAQARLEAQQKVKAKEAARKEAQQRAAAKIRAKKAAKIEKRNDESAELDLEMKRLKVEQARSKVGVDKAINSETVNRAKDIVDTDVEMGRAKVEQIRSQNKAIEKGLPATVTPPVNTAPTPSVNTAPKPVSSSTHQTQPQREWWRFWS